MGQLSSILPAEVTKRRWATIGTGGLFIQLGTAHATRSRIVREAGAALLHVTSRLQPRIPRIRSSWTDAGHGFTWQRYCSLLARRDAFQMPMTRQH